MQSLLVALAVTIYCAWQARGLVSDWRWSPFNRWCVLAFVIWLVPAIVEYALYIRGNRKLEPATFLLWTGLAFSLVGSLGELNVLRHVGLALALVGCVSWRWSRLPWLAVAVAWMPVFGYAASKTSVSASTTGMIRLALVALISGWLLMLLKRRLLVQT